MLASGTPFQPTPAAKDSDVESEGRPEEMRHKVVNCDGGAIAGAVVGALTVVLPAGIPCANFQRI